MVFCCGEYFGILANLFPKIQTKLEIMSSLRYFSVIFENVKLKKKFQYRRNPQKRRSLQCIQMPHHLLLWLTVDPLPLWLLHKSGKRKPLA
jgi:hypothetical protein